MKRIIISILLLTILCSVIFCGCTEDKEVATKDEVAVTTTSTSVVTETTASEVVTSTSATETTVSTTTATTVAPEATKNVVSEQVEVEDDDYENESYNSGSNNQNSNSTENDTASSSTDKSTANSNNGKVTKIVFDNDYITMDVGDVVKVGFTMDGIPAELHCNDGQPNQIKTKLLFIDRVVQITACRAGEATFTLSTDNGVEATCTVYVNYPSVDYITGDTVLSYDQINTEKVSQMICDEFYEYFTNLGMTYEPSFNKDNSGWFIAHHCSAFGTTNYTYEELIEWIKDGLMADIDAVLIDMYGYEYEDYRFNMTYFMEGNSYVIIFCYG